MPVKPRPLNQSQWLSGGGGQCRFCRTGGRALAGRYCGAAGPIAGEEQINNVQIQAIKPITPNQNNELNKKTNFQAKDLVMLIILTDTKLRK